VSPPAGVFRDALHALAGNGAGRGAALAEGA
jgi:hypothetical protein